MLKDRSHSSDPSTLQRGPTRFALARLAAGQSRVLSPLFTERFAEHTASPYTPNPLPGTPDASDEPGNPTTPGDAS